MNKSAFFQIDLINGFSLKIEAFTYADAVRCFVRAFGFNYMYMIKSIHNIDLSNDPNYYGN